jgi:hypothetical protein
MKATITITNWENIDKLCLESKQQFFNELEKVFNKWHLNGGIIL